VTRDKFVKKIPIVGKRFNSIDNFDKMDKTDKKEEEEVLTPQNGGKFEWLDDEQQNMRVLLDDYYNTDDDDNVTTNDEGGINESGMTIWEQNSNKISSVPIVCLLRILPSNLMPPPPITLTIPFCEKSIDAFQKSFTQYVARAVRTKNEESKRRVENEERSD